MAFKFVEKLRGFEAVAVIFGAIVGAGVLSIPFVFAQAGFLTGVVVLLAVGLALTILRLFYGEIIMRTEKRHQLAGYAGVYLGKYGRNIQAMVLILSIYGTLLAYTIGQGEILKSLLGGVLGGSSEFWSLTFFLVFSAAIMGGIWIIKHVEFILSLLIFLIVALIVALSSNGFEQMNITGFEFSNLFIPFGVILFATAGMVAVPEAREVFGDSVKGKTFLKVLIWGSIIPPALYLVFAMAVVGVTGAQTTEIATIGMGESLGDGILLIGNLFAFIAVATSFLTLGLALREIFQYDYGFSKKTAFLLTVSVPITLFLVGARDFITILGFVGSLGVGITGILSIIVFWRAKKVGQRKPEYEIPSWFAVPASLALTVVFLSGIVAVLA